MLCPLLLPICPFAKGTEGQIVSWGSWAGSNTEYCLVTYPKDAAHPRSKNLQHSLVT